jgi:hypothetical protein
MSQFNVTKFVMVAASTTPYLATDVYKVHEEGANLKIDGVDIEIKGAENPNPDHVVANGRMIELRVTLLAADMTEFAKIMQANPTVLTPAMKSKYDVFFGTRHVDKDGALSLRYHHVTNVHIDSSMELAFKAGESSYLPLVFKSTSDSVYEMTDAEPIASS